MQSWLDELHLKRQVLEATFNRRKSQLEQCLALAMLASDLRELEDIVNDRRELLSNSRQLGKFDSNPGGKFSNKILFQVTLHQALNYY